MDDLVELLHRVADDNKSIPFNGGEIGCAFFRINYFGKKAVIKIGRTDTRAGFEIKKNLSAYSEMEQLGIAKHISPRIYESGSQGQLDYIILEDAGLDFRKIANSANIGIMTDTLINSLNEVYVLTNQSNPNCAFNWLTGIKNNMKKYFTEHLMRAGYVSDSDLLLLDKLDIKNISPNNVAWSTADLTPDNVFINNGRLIVIDPMPNALGVPLVDLAMFSTLSGEIYELPNGNFCAKRIKFFAEKVSYSLAYGNLGDLLFKFGEARQYTLSSRFRIGKDPRAYSFARNAVQKIEEILNNLK